MGQLQRGYLCRAGEPPRAADRAWTRWARWSIEHLELFGAWSIHVDQVAFALAVAEQSFPIEELPREFNSPTHHGDIGQATAPRLVHYHRHVDSQWLLLPSGDGVIDAALETANTAIRRWRRDDLVNNLFWTARYATNPELGSGVGSRGAHLERKRALLRQLIPLLRVSSIVDIGGGDGSVMEGLAEATELRVIDVAPGAEAEYRKRNPGARFAVGDIVQQPAERADLGVCLDVLIHQADSTGYRQAVRNVLASVRVAALISGFDGPTEWQSSLTYYHEPLHDTLARHPDVVALPVLADRGSVTYLVLKDADPGPFLALTPLE